MNKSQLKNIVFLASVLLLTLSGSLFFIYGSSDATSRKGLDWEMRNREIESRLLAVPIILYHNIDGKGAFSVDYDVIKKQFNTARDLGVRIVPLKELVEKLEKRGSFNEKVAVITFDDGFIAMYTKLLPLVREFGYPVTLFVYTDNIVTRGTKSLDWKKLREMDSGGIAVECHTRSHADLTKLSKSGDPRSQKKLFDELYLSKRVLELYMNREITMFAFPYGRYDLKLIYLCGLAGYRRVFSTDYGSNIVTRDNYCLKRQHIKNNYSLEKIASFIR